MAFKGEQCSEDKFTGITYQGKEVILSKTRGQPPKGLVRIGLERGIFSQEKIIEAATLYAVTGDVQKMCELSGINPKHSRKLVRSEAFQRVLQEIREENDAKFDAKFSEIVEKAQDELLDRLKNGDTVMTKQGPTKVPVKARDAAQIISANFDKLQLIRGKPTSRSESVSGSGKLEALADQFIKISQKFAKKQRDPEVIDVEVVDAIEKQEASKDNGGSGTQSSIRKEGGDSD